MKKQNPVSKKYSILILVAKISLIIILLAVACIIAFGFYSNNASYKADDYAKNDLSYLEGVTVKNSETLISFVSSNKDAKGFIFYPGGFVDPVAYAPVCRLVAASGDSCFIPKMQFNLAIFGINSAEAIISQNSEISEWFIGGHSLGGPMAARYVKSDTSGKIKGMFFFASYTDIDLSNTNLKCVTITGSKDSVLNTEQYSSNKSKLPKDCAEVTIEGGNHSQFGSYGLQKGDTTATISKEEQFRQIYMSLSRLK